MSNVKNLELLNWWTSETDDFKRLVWSMLYSLPGSDRAEDMGVFALYGIDKAFCGWQELTMIGDMINALNDSSDVAELTNALLKEDGYFDDDDSDDETTEDDELDSSDDEGTD